MKATGNWKEISNDTRLKKEIILQWEGKRSAHEPQSRWEQVN